MSDETSSICQNHSNENDHASGFHKLSQAAAHSALHNAPGRADQSRCHQHSRVDIFDHLERWAQGICDEGAPIMWLHGGAGAGKSAVMQTFAERCVAQRLSLGSFFFSRSDPTRDSAMVLIPTLVYQLAQSFPALSDVIDSIINHDPSIFEQSFHTQSRVLLVGALLHLVQLGVISDTPKAPRVFLIDALDERNDAVQQQAVVQAIAEVCHEHNIPVKFLIASRVAPSISASFNSYKDLNRILGVISLSDDPGAESDIRRFLEGEFQEMRLKHPYKDTIPSEWPDRYHINALVRKSSSHFIYASTAMKYIWSAKSPTRSLQVVLGLEVSRTEPPFTKLDAIYHHVLRSAAHIDKVLQILAHCLASRFPPSSGSIAFFLDISKDDLLLFMADVAPLVVLQNPGERSPFSEDELVVEILHASLGDFLSDQSRSGRLYVDKAAYLGSKLEKCFRLLDLHTRGHLIQPDWLGYSFGVAEHMRYTLPTVQITQTIQEAGHLGEVQVALSQYSLLDFYRWQLSCQGYISRFMTGLLCDLLSFFLAVQSLESDEDVSFFGSYEDDFLNILRSHITLKSTPAAAAIFTLITIGRPAQAVCQALAAHLNAQFTWHFEMLDSALVALGEADFASTLDTLTPSLQRLSVAAEAILEYIFDDKMPLRYRPPGRRLQELVLEEITMTSSLLNNLLWMLPKAGLSTSILPYCNKRLSRNNHLQIYDDLISRVEQCLHEYAARVQGSLYGREHGNATASSE